MEITDKYGDTFNIDPKKLSGVEIGKVMKKSIKKLSKDGIRGSIAGKGLRESLKQFKDINEAIKKMMPLSNMPFAKGYLKQHKENTQGLAYLSFCGISITDQVLNEIEKIRETTPRTFKESCYYYVNNLPS